MQVAAKYKLKRGYPLEEYDLCHGEDFTSLSRGQMMVRMEQCLLQTWQDRWDDVESTGRVTYKFIPDVELVYRDPNFGFTMRTGFLLTGHGSMNAFLCRIGTMPTAACLCGAPCEDWQHVLCDCPNYADLRDLDGLGVQQDGGNWIGFDGILVDQERTRRLTTFAEEAFNRRRDL